MSKIVVKIAGALVPQYQSEQAAGVAISMRA